jgi:hypothetical protein
MPGFRTPVLAQVFTLSLVMKTLLLFSQNHRAWNNRMASGSERCKARAGLRSDMQHSSRSCRRQQRAATTQTPRRPIGAGGVRGASRAGSASVITTHARFARKVQRKLTNGVAGFAAGRSSSDRRRDRGQFMPSRRRRTMANVRAERLLKIPAEPSPELRIPRAAAQTRMVSVAEIRRGSGKSARAFKGIICDDISEFESSHPSHAVGSPAAKM